MSHARDMGEMVRWGRGRISIEMDNQQVSSQTRIVQARRRTKPYGVFKKRGVLSMALPQSLELARQFDIWLRKKTDDKNRSEGVRNRTAESILQQSLDIDDGIIILLDHQLPGPTLAFARSLFKCYGWGFWLLKLAPDSEIEQF